MSPSVRPSHHLPASSSTAALRWVAPVVLGLLQLSSACATPPAASADHVQPSPLTRFEGDVALPNGAALHYGAVLVPDPLREGGYLGTIDIPQQALAGASLEELRFLPGEHVEFQLGVSGSPRWVGHYNADGTLACRFFQAENSLPCTMREIAASVPRPPAPALARQTPRPPFPYQVSQVQVENRGAHLVLAGTLSVPSGPGAHPALLLLGDGNARDRDGTQGQHKPYLVLADHLTRAGFAVLRLDDRGVGGSAGGVPEPTAQDLEEDARTALGFLRSRPHVDLRRVGLLAHGRTAPLAARMAATDASVAFLVLLAEPSEPNAVVQEVSCPVLALSGEQDGAAEGSAAPGIAEQTMEPAALERISTWLAHTLRP